MTNYEKFVCTLNIKKVAEMIDSNCDFCPLYNPNGCSICDLPEYENMSCIETITLWLAED